MATFAGRCRSRRSTWDGSRTSRSHGSTRGSRSSIRAMATCSNAHAVGNSDCIRRRPRARATPNRCAMRSSALVLVALVACNSDTAESPIGPPVTRAEVPLPEKAPAGVPHGGPITHVAVTEKADAAVTVDNLGGLRLWPSLDGKREPVPFTVNGAEALAITHAGDELLVGVVDQAGAGHLVRFSRGGVQRGKIQLPGDVAIDQIAAVDGGMLVARNDQSIERYDAAGTLRGRIAADPSTSFGTLAVRHGIAAVMLVGRETSDGPATLPKRRHKKPSPPSVVVVEHARAL